MKFTVSRSAPESFKADIIAIGCYEREPEDGKGTKPPALIKHADGGISLDKAMDGELHRQIQAEKFTGERGSSRMFFTAGRIPARFILITGLGRRDKLDLEVMREAGARMARAAREVKATSVALVLERGSLGSATESQSARDDTAAARARAIAEGIILGSYSFELYKTSKDKKSPKLSLATFLYQGEASSVRESIETGRSGAEAQLLCRDLVNTPGSDATPAKLAEKAREVAKRAELKVTIWGPAEIKKAKMNCLFAVAKGSAEPPAFIIMEYKPKDKTRLTGVSARPHVALIGKGITFDSGGISIKPSRGMEQMKGDMAGAAAVLAAMEAIAKAAPPIDVTAYIPIAENMPDGKALKPGDVITARNGKTIEIISTDAEGRLVLADALAYASESEPDAIVDLATLTGGAAYCCGELYTIAVGTDQKLFDRLRRAAEATGERIWQLPMVEEYRKGYTSGIADLNNSGKGKAQTILGGIFLREFVEDLPWVHLDIAASSWTDEEL
nr:leucyl aminopeptidase [bacterium]